MDTTPGRAFYDRQIAYLEANDVDGLIPNQYAPDAELVGFDGLHIKGTEALIAHFKEYIAHLGGLKVLSTDKFAEIDDAIMFEATVKVAAGTARVYDVFVFNAEGKTIRHFTGMLGFTPNP